MFCYNYDDINPDLVIVAKSLSGGMLPVSLLMGKKEVFDVIRPGDHGSTFGGNPLACAVSKEAVKVLIEE